MEQNANTEAFLEIAKAVGQEMGMKVHPIERFGGSDGCFTAALGFATLDVMGPICYESCSETERIDANSLVPRTLLRGWYYSTSRNDGEKLKSVKWIDRNLFVAGDTDDGSYVLYIGVSRIFKR